MSCSRLWFCHHRNTEGRKTPKASKEAGGAPNCWAWLRFILPKGPVIHWEHCGQTKSTCHLLCVRGTPSLSVLLAVDVDMYASVNGCQQHGEMVTGLLLPLWHTRARTAALQSESKWVCFWLHLACPGKLAHFIQTAWSLWIVKGATRITWDLGLVFVKCFDLKPMISIWLVWLSLQSYYFNQHHFKLCLDVFATWTVTLCRYGVQEKPETSADWDWVIGFPSPRWRSMNKQASLKKTQTLIFWMIMENSDEKGSQEVIYIIPLSTDGWILSLSFLTKFYLISLLKKIYNPLAI